MGGGGADPDVRAGRWSAGDVRFGLPAAPRAVAAGEAAVAWVGVANAERWTGDPAESPEERADPWLADGRSVAGAHHGLGIAASPSSSPSPPSPSASRWRTTAGRIGLCAAIGRIAGPAARWIGSADAEDAPVDPLAVAPAADGDPSPAPSRAERDTASTGRAGRDCPEEDRELPEAEAVRCTGASPSSPSSSPSPWRWTVVRIVEVANAIGPAIVDRLTIGVDGLPTGRAVGGRLVGSPTPRRDDPGARAGSDEAAAPDAGIGASDIVSDDVDAWRLAVGMALRASTGFDGARRIPPVGAGRAVDVACEPPADCAAFE